MNNVNLLIKERIFLIKEIDRLECLRELNLLVEDVEIQTLKEELKVLDIEIRRIIS